MPCSRLDLERLCRRNDGFARCSRFSVFPGAHQKLNRTCALFTLQRAPRSPPLREQRAWYPSSLLQTTLPPSNPPTPSILVYPILLPSRTLKPVFPFHSFPHPILRSSRVSPISCGVNSPVPPVGRWVPKRRPCLEFSFMRKSHLSRKGTPLSSPAFAPFRGHPTFL